MEIMLPPGALATRRSSRKAPVADTAAAGTAPAGAPAPLGDGRTGKLRRRRAWRARYLGKAQSRKLARKAARAARVGITVASALPVVKPANGAAPAPRPRLNPVAFIPRPPWCHPRAYAVAARAVGKMLDRGANEPRNWTEWLAEIWRLMRAAQTDATGRECKRLPSDHPFDKEGFGRWLKSAAELRAKRLNGLGPTTDATPAGKERTKVRRVKPPEPFLARLKATASTAAQAMLGSACSTAAVLGTGSFRAELVITDAPGAVPEVKSVPSYYGGNRYRVSIPLRWYVRVWLRGLAVVADRPVVDAERYPDGRVRVAYAEMVGDTPRLRWAWLTRTAHGWLAMMNDADANTVARSAELAAALAEL